VDVWDNYSRVKETVPDTIVGLRLSLVIPPLQSHAAIVARLESNEFISDTSSSSFKVVNSKGLKGNLLHPDN